MVRCLVQMTNQRSKVNTELIDHLGNARNVVVAGANEADESLPSILLEDAYPCELWSLLPEVGVSSRPLIVELSEVGFQVEVVFDQLGRVVVFESVD
jgi:hypothetical protein